MAFLASLFGYLLNFIYDLVNNYGLAIIIFTIIIKLLMLPISIKQQKTMKKSTRSHPGAACLPNQTSSRF